MRLGFLYPPTQVSTATSQGCLYSCDACTLRAVHLLSHSPQPADFTWTAGCTRDKATAIWSIFLCQGRLFLFCSPGWGNLQVLMWRENLFLSPAAKPHVSNPRWWAGYANLPLSSALHLALAKSSGFTKVQARPCSTPRQGHSTMHRGHHCLDWRERWAHNLRLGFLYPPTQVSTATSQGCLYSCDACTLRAVHLLSQLEKMSFSQPFPLFQSPISSPAAVAVAAVNRRVARAPPGTKTARHGRTNRPQNRTEKVPNVPSEFLEKCLFPNLFRFFNLPSAHLLLLLLLTEE